MKRFIVQKSEHKPNHWVCTDVENSIICVFENKNFNDTQSYTLMDDTELKIYSELVRITNLNREMEDWLHINHCEKFM